MAAGSVLVACVGVCVCFLRCSRRLYRLRDDLLVPVANGMCCLFGLPVDAVVVQVWWAFCLLLVIGLVDVVGSLVGVGWWVRADVVG